MLKWNENLILNYSSEQTSQALDTAAHFSQLTNVEMRCGSDAFRWRFCNTGVQSLLWVMRIFGNTGVQSGV